jgi:secreted trypsin-like serine protease
MSLQSHSVVVPALLAFLAITACPATASGIPTAASPKRQEVVKDLEGNWTFRQVARIVGGRDAMVGEVPWQVALIISDLEVDSAQYLCGGSMIENGWVLTAAHCVQGYESAAGKILAISGALDINDIASTRKVATRVIVHPLYCSGTQDYDVALVKVEATGTPAKLTTVRPAQNTPALVSGWGTTTESGKTSPTLRIVEVSIKSATACNESAAYDGHVSDKMVCAGPGGKAPADSCQGDSGGPLFAKDNPKAQLGIVSWGEGCARDGKFGVYADVASLQKWINDHAN